VLKKKDAILAEYEMTQQRKEKAMLERMKNSVD